MNSRRLTEGPILHNLLLFAFPMMLGNLLQQIYNIVDAIIVGRYIGPAALAAVGASYTLMTFLTSLIIGLCMGSGAILSKSFGAKRLDEMVQDARLSFLFIGSVTAVIYLLIFPGTNLILHALAIPQEIYDLMREYIRIIFIGIGGVFLYNYFAYLMRSMGNSVLPLFFLGLASVLNIVLDFYFVLNLGLGVAGTAIATVLAQYLAGMGMLLYTLLWKDNPLRSTRYSLHSDESANIGNSRERFLFIIKNDIFTGLQQSVMNLGILMIQGLVNSFGTTIMAAFTAAVKIDTLAYMPAQEFGNAYSLFVSQNYGAGKQERIRRGTKISLTVSALFCMLISLLIWGFADRFMEVFVEAQETAIISAGICYLRIEGSFYFGIGILFLLYGYFRGIQKPEMSLVLTIISLGTRVLLAYLFAPTTRLGVLAIWWAIPIGWILADTVGIWRMKQLQKGVKKHESIESDS